MSSGWAGGSTRAWRKLREFVLDRDGWRCQVVVDGVKCNRPARTAGHLDPLCKGGVKLADPARLQAQCEPHNYSDGARLANAGRKRRAWSW